MSQFEVAVYQTSTLGSYCDSAFADTYRAQKRAETYIEGAFSKTSHSISVQTPSVDVPAPTENVKESFEADYPCDKSFTISYDSLLSWWQDYVDCKLSKPSDAIILITNEPSYSGRSIKNFYSVAEAGGEIANLPSHYDEYGCTGEFTGMRLTLHEIAHNFLQGGKDGFDEHYVGDTYTRGGDYSRTPMVTSESENGVNECGEYANSASCKEMTWDECCYSKFNNTSNHL